MADDTLSPVGFETSRIVKAHMSGQDRYALACANGSIGQGAPQAAFVRHVLLVGLEQLGWPEEKMIEEYAAYRVRCIQNGETNPYESE